MENLIFNIIGFTLPALIVMGTAYVVLSEMIKNTQRMKQLDLLQKSKNEALPIRLQAYERLTLYLERINPQHLIARTLTENMTAPELQFALITTIRAELEHNVTQQLYVSPAAWTMVRSVSEEIISVINRVGSSMPTDAEGMQFSQTMLNFLIANEMLTITDNALAQLQDEAKTYL